MPFTEKPQAVEVPCPKCGQRTVTARRWESSDGAHEDEKYECTNRACNHFWWIDGIDA